MKYRKNNDSYDDLDFLDEPKTNSKEDDLFKDEFKEDQLNNDLMNNDSDLNMSDGIAPLEKHNDLLKELTDFNPFLREKVNGWLGLIWNEKKEKYSRHPLITPIMNIKCASWCIEFLKTYARDNNIITNIGHEDYQFMNHDIIEVLWINLGLRYEEFGIKHNGDIKRLCVELEHAANLVLMGAGDGKYNALLKDTVNRSENVMTQQEPTKKGGVINGIKNMFRG